MERAIAALDSEEVEVKVTWQPFELNSNLPEKSVSKLASYKKKFGAERIKSMIPYMKQVGAAEKIAFSYGGKIGNTFRSHRLVELALEKDSSLQLQNNFIEALFSAYFEQEKDIANNTFLVELACGAGLFDTVQEGKDFLESDQLVSEVRSKMLSNSKEGISGVPFFKIDNKFSLEGAQDAEAFLTIFRKLE